MDPVEGGPTTGPSSFRVFRWWDPPVVGVALLAMAAGFGQFGAVAALGSVAKTFGHVTHGATFADEAGLSGTVLGVGLAIARLASLAGLPLAGLADRFGRRPTLLATCALGLALTIVAAVAPGYWWFVVIFALGRPLLSATQGVTQVSAAELTSSAERAKGVALVAAGYAAGAGLTAIIHSLAGNALGFRGIFALAVVPLMLLPLVARLVVEPGRFVQVAATEHRRPVLGPVGREFRGRLVVVASLAMAFSVITGPANSLVFIYAQNFLHVSGVVTSAMVVGAGVSGLGGLLVGRWLADRWGRRPTVAVSMVGLAAFGTLAYSRIGVGADRRLRPRGHRRRRLRPGRRGAGQRAVPDLGAGVGGWMVHRRRGDRRGDRVGGLRSGGRRRWRQGPRGLRRRRGLPSRRSLRRPAGAPPRDARPGARGSLAIVEVSGPARPDADLRRQTTPVVAGRAAAGQDMGHEDRPAVPMVDRLRRFGALDRLQGLGLSIGSVGSVLSIGSIGSFGSVLSIGSFLSVGSLLSAASLLSVLSWRSRRGVLAQRAKKCQPSHIQPSSTADRA